MTNASPPRARLFVALDLPAEVRGELARWRDGVMGRVEGLRAVAEEGLHVTLCFLGGRPETEIPRLEEVVRGSAAGTRAPALTVGESRWLPRRRAPRVLTVELRDEGGVLGGLQARVGRALEEAGAWTPEKRPFLPHVTVARVRSDARVRAVEVADPPTLAFAGGPVTLYRSRLARTGARYEPLARVDLA